MEPPSAADTPRSRPYRPAVGPRLRRLLLLVLGLFSLLGLNAAYLASVTATEWFTGQVIQGYFYQYMFLGHLVLGLLLVPPLLLFGAIHIKNAHGRPNRRAVRAGYGLFVSALVLVGSGFLLVRLEGFLPLRTPSGRNVAYWVHVLSPLVVIWLFILHRLAGPPLRWRVGLSLAAVGAGFAIVMVFFHAQDPRRWDTQGPAAGEQYFHPSLARTATGNFIPARTLQQDAYCRECHADIHRGWEHSVHRLSSFNNPAYLFAVQETRRVVQARDGNVRASRFCAGCHDPVPFFSGAFEEPAFDDPDFRVEEHPTAAAGITCTSCHAITHVAASGILGNADYTIDEPVHYPFAFSDNPVLRWLNRQLIKAKPAFHKKTFLKPLHKTTEFCGTCHKVHLPKELNHYKWLRGQNHYDSFLLSGVSGHGVASFYYPPTAQTNCNGCHMPLETSEDFAAAPRDDSGLLKIHDHQFPSANTAIPHLLGLPDWVNEKHREFLEGTLRVDIFGLKKGAAIDGELIAPLEESTEELEPGKSYLLEVVVRNVSTGHAFTQGTSDSNEVWLDVRAETGGRVVGRSGGRAADGSVDPWSHFVNSYVLDRAGNRIDRRNPQDIFVPLYSHQIPPGAADVVHYRLRVPENATGAITVDVKLRYRKFDTTFLKHIYGDDYKNELPIVDIAADRITLPLAGSTELPRKAAAPAPRWERWNDYGIGLLRKGDKGSRKGELRQAEAAFAEVERLGRPEGPLHRARVYIREGRLEDAVSALQKAAAHTPPAAPWSVAWFTATVNEQNGRLDEAIQGLRSLVETAFPEARQRGFDFSRDYRLLNKLGGVLFERAKRERGEARAPERERLLREALGWFQQALALDRENVTAHYNIAQLFAQLGEPQHAKQHRELHATYKPDDNAREQAVALHRKRNPAADHAAEAIVIYDLHRPRAFGLEPPAEEQ